MIEGVDKSFCSAAMARYLTSRTTATITHVGQAPLPVEFDNPLPETRSFPFCPLEDENNCSRVWQKVIKHLITSDITTARVMSHWNTLFGLKYQSRDDFVAFYLKTKGILQKLRKVKSVEVTDNVFLKAYFSMVIEARNFK